MVHEKVRKKSIQHLHNRLDNKHYMYGLCNFQVFTSIASVMTCGICAAHQLTFSMSVRLTNALLGVNVFPRSESVINIPNAHCKYKYRTYFNISYVGYDHSKQLHSAGILNYFFSWENANDRICSQALN